VQLDAFILAAGFGTRISALSRLRPKPLLPLGSTTPLARAVERLRAAGAGRIVANAAHLSEQIVAAGGVLGIEVVVEGAPSGTAGGLAAARGRLRADRVAVWNGDIVADLDVGALVRALDEPHVAGPARAALAVHDRRTPGHGNVGVAADGRIVRLRGVSFPALGEEAYGALFSAVHVLDRGLVERAPREGCLVGDLYLPALAEGAFLRAVPWDGAWHDIGDVGSYLAANLALLDARAGAGAHPALAFAGASIAPGVELRRSIVGAGACVEGDGVLEEVVVWPGAQARAPLSRAIVVGDGAVVEVVERLAVVSGEASA
jgi:mannose-1-phosphate guanylyltransferase